jgi:hypothetical protein
MSGRNSAEQEAIGAPQSWPMMIAGEPRPASASQGSGVFRECPISV